jgi:hypothetical protein
MITPQQAARLSRSKQTDVRQRAVGTGKLNRSCLLELASGDDDLGIRQEALRPLVPPSESEFRKLAGSRHPEMRALAAASGLLASRQLVPLADDPDSSVRHAAWSQLVPMITPQQAARLSRSKQTDVRQRAVGTRKLNRSCLFELAYGDENLGIRQASLRLLEPPSGGEVRRLAVSRHPEMRAWAAASGLLSPTQLAQLGCDEDSSVRGAAWSQMVHLCATDPDRRVRESAWKTLRASLSVDEAAAIADSKYPDSRRHLLEIHSVSRRVLLSLAAFDADQSLRAEALHRLGPLSEADALRLSQSQFTDIRLFALRSGHLSIARVREMLEDPVIGVGSQARSILDQRSEGSQ